MYTISLLPPSFYGEPFKRNRLGEVISLSENKYFTSSEICYIMTTYKNNFWSLGSGDKHITTAIPTWKQNWKPVTYPQSFCHICGIFIDDL